MSTFPQLLTGAVQQYPYVCALGSETRVFQFADGTEQRYAARPVRRMWLIQLSLLQDSERAAFLDFAQDALRGQTAFAFTDPQDGTVYPTCRIAAEPITDEVDGVARTAIQFVIMEAPQ